MMYEQGILALVSGGPPDAPLSAGYHGADDVKWAVDFMLVAELFPGVVQRLFFGAEERTGAEPVVETGADEHPPGPFLEAGEQHFDRFALPGAQRRVARLVYPGEKRKQPVKAR